MVNYYHLNTSAYRISGGKNFLFYVEFNDTLIFFPMKYIENSQLALNTFELQNMLRKIDDIVMGIKSEFSISHPFM